MKSLHSSKCSTWNTQHQTTPRIGDTRRDNKKTGALACAAQVFHVEQLHGEHKPYPAHPILLIGLAKPNPRSLEIEFSSRAAGLTQAGKVKRLILFKISSCIWKGVVIYGYLNRAGVGAPAFSRARARFVSI